jgi:hypothetical protein
MHPPPKGYSLVTAFGLACSLKDIKSSLFCLSSLLSNPPLAFSNSQKTGGIICVCFLHVGDPHKDNMFAKTLRFTGYVRLEKDYTKASWIVLFF